MTRKEAERLTRQEDTLRGLGFTREEADQLRRISMTLHAWHERECGTDNGCIERNDATQRPYWHSAGGGRYPMVDREKGALKRLKVIMAVCNTRRADDIDGKVSTGTHLPVDGKPLTAYVQTDPRGAALYILRPGDVPEGGDAGSYYTRGICVY